MYYYVSNYTYIYSYYLKYHFFLYIKQYDIQYLNNVICIIKYFFYIILTLKNKLLIKTLCKT